MEQTLEERIVELREQGFTYDEIAEKTGTYKSKVHRVLASVSDKLELENEEMEQEEQGSEMLELELETLRNEFETLEQRVEQKIGTFQKSIETLGQRFKEFQEKVGTTEQENEAKEKQNEFIEAKSLCFMSENMKKDIKAFIEYFEFGLEQPRAFTKTHLESMKNAGAGAICMLISFLHSNAFEYKFMQSFIKLYFSLFVAQNPNKEHTGYIIQELNEIDFQEYEDIFKDLRLRYIISQSIIDTI